MTGRSIPVNAPLLDGNEKALLAECIAGRLRSSRNLGFRERRFVHDVLGWTFRLSNLLDDSVDFEARDASTRLSQRGVGTRPFFWPMHEQPVLRAMGLFADVRVAAGHCRALLEAA